MIGSIIGGVGSLVGGISNAILGGQSIKAQKQINAQNLAMQKEFAQNSIQWRTADAKKAGIHPLYALGANGASYTPQSFDSSGYQQMGQGISDAMNGLALAGQKLQNDLLASQVEAQRISNASQKSKVMDEINTGLLVNKVLGKPLGSKSAIRGLETKDDFKQVFQDTASESWLRSLWDTYNHLDPKTKQTHKVDFGRSLGGALELIPKDQPTLFDDGIENLKDWTYRALKWYTRTGRRILDESKMPYDKYKRYKEHLKKYGLD